jgi:hypothetical protein
MELFYEVAQDPLRGDDDGVRPLAQIAQQEAFNGPTRRRRDLSLKISRGVSAEIRDNGRAQTTDILGQREEESRDMQHTHDKIILLRVNEAGNPAGGAIGKEGMFVLKHGADLFLGDPEVFEEIEGTAEIVPEGERPSKSQEAGRDTPAMERQEVEDAPLRPSNLHRRKEV